MGRAAPVHAALHESRRGMALEEEKRPGMKLRLLAAVVLFLPALAFADSSALIIQGVAGSPEHEMKFNKWTAGTQKALVDKFGFSQDRVIVLVDKKSAQAEIQKAFATLKTQLKT